MAIIERVLLQLYTALLWLYPQEFRQDFAAEMQTVFGDALAAACRDGPWAVVGLCSRELRELPRSLVREHCQSGKKKETDMEKNMRFPAGPEGTDAQVGRQAPVHNWGDVLLAALPFLLILLLDILLMALVESGLQTWEDSAKQLVNTVLITLLLITFLLILILAWRRRWPAWSSSWYLFYVLPLPLLATWLLSLLFDWDGVQGVFLYLFLPLTIAVLLYTVTRQQRLRGLLTALPVLYFLWYPNMEFVPDPIEISIKVASIALLCLAIAYLMRRGNWRSGLYAILATNLVVGALFSYAGIYHGGTLPFVAPGPNLVEVGRSFVPQYLATSAILLGPLFARKLRQIGRSGGRLSQAGYHLALAGLLLVILANLTSIMKEMGSAAGPIDSFFNNTVLTVEIILGLGAYLLGLFWVYWDGFVGREPGWIQRGLLALLPLTIPLTFILPFITWRWPISDLYGIPLLWVLPHGLSLSVGIVWLALSVWVVTRTPEVAGPTSTVGEASDMPVPG